MKLKKHTFLGFLLLLLSFKISAQQSTRKELEAHRKKLQKEIQQVNKLLFDAQKREKNILEDLKDLNKKIEIRERLINTIRLETKALINEIETNEKQLQKLSKELKKLKSDYGAMIYKSYKSKSLQNRTLFLLSSESFYQAYKRLQYMKQYASYQKKQGIRIQQKTYALNQLKDSLLVQKQQKNTLLTSEIKEKNQIESEMKEQEKLMAQIKEKEDFYKIELKEKQREEKTIIAKIDRLIKEEIRKDNAKAGSKSSTSFTLTPETKALALRFEQNKGRLPWPVENGLIVRRFGSQPHPTLRGITIQSTGLHIVTNKNADAESIFNGEVLAVLTLSEGKKSVMVRHGNYITAYNNLEEVYVNKGDEVRTNQVLGKIFTDKITGKTKLVFVLFKNRQRLNPLDWIAKR